MNRNLQRDSYSQQMAKDVDLSQSIQTKGVYHPKLRARIPDMSMQLQASATN